MRILLIFAIVFASEASAELDLCGGEYSDPDRVNRRGFLDEDRALALAVKDRWDWYHTFDATGCFDLSDHSNQLGSVVSFFINNANADQRSTYIASTMLKVDVIESVAEKEQAEFKATFRRNDSSKWMQLPVEGWLTSRDPLSDSIEGTVKTTNVDRIFFAGGYQSSAVQLEAMGSDLVSLPLSERPLALWHGLLAEPLNDIQRNAFVIMEDTTENAGSAFFPKLSSFLPEHRVTIRHDLVAFNLTPAPTLRIPILTTHRRSCIYLSYKIGGDFDYPSSVSVLENIPPIIVVRLGADALC